MVKPFSYAELLGRVQALLRRYQVYRGKKQPQMYQDTWIKAGNLRLHRERNMVEVDEREVKLTETEHKILLLLMENPGKTYSAQQLYEQAWKEPYLYTSNGTVMVHIRKLRLKIEKTPERPTHILTVWGRGYRFV